MSDIIIGESSALMGAAALGMHGAATLLFSGSLDGLGTSQPPLRGGRLRTAADPGTFEPLLGALLELDAARSFLYASGKAWPLPLSVTTVHKLFRPGLRRKAARGWIKARIRNATSSMTGSYVEERSYRDWVARRMGDSAYGELYAPYAQARWGMKGEELCCGRLGISSAAAAGL